MLAWIKRNKYLLGFLIAVIAIGYFGYGYYKSSIVENQLNQEQLLQHPLILINRLNHCLQVDGT